MCNNYYLTVEGENAIEPWEIKNNHHAEKWKWAFQKGQTSESNRKFLNQLGFELHLEIEVKLSILSKNFYS